MNLFVSRQNYWGVEDPLVVEISEGGIEYANPDMLADESGKYRELGCDQEYSNPFEALAAAFRVRYAWENFWRDQGHFCKPRIEVVWAGGNTLPSEEYPSNADLVRWAKEAFDSIEKCKRCGDPLEEDYWTLYGDESFGKFCSQFCVEEYEWEMYQEWECDEEN